MDNIKYIGCCSYGCSQTLLYLDGRVTRFGECLYEGVSDYEYGHELVQIGNILTCEYKDVEKYRVPCHMRIMFIEYVE
jgi:hypothetical protein